MAHKIPHVRMLRGDEAELFRTYEVALRCAVRHNVAATEAIVEDACSFAWLQLLRHQPDRDTVFAWLRVVAVREGWRLAGRQRREQPIEELPAGHHPRTDAVDQTVAAYDALATLASLPDRQRRYLSLVVSGCSYGEIAQHCGVTHTNVNKHLTRARRHLRLVRTDA